MTWKTELVNQDSKQLYNPYVQEAGVNVVHAKWSACLSKDRRFERPKLDF